MNKLFANKKICIAILVLVILVLAGIIVGVVLRGNQDKDVAGKEDKEQDIIVYETDKNTIEEKAEEGLQASDSEDGPVLDENSMIDFNGSDTTSNHTNTGNVDEPKNENQNDDKKNDSKDTGSWGAFY